MTTATGSSKDSPSPAQLRRSRDAASGRRTPTVASIRPTSRNLQVRLLSPIFILVVLCSAAFGQGTEASVAEVDRIHVGDLIDVDVLGTLEFDWRGRLTPEGFLLDYSASDERINALCNSPQELSLKIENALKRMLREPKVVVRILDTSSRPTAVVYGAVRTPQRFQLKRQVSLAELIVLSGGLTDQLGGEIQVFRPANQSCGAGAVSPAPDMKATEGNGSTFLNISLSDLLKGKPESNPEIFSGDIVTVNEAFPVYVIGGVNNPRPVQFREGMTLSRAIAAAGGLSRDGRPDDVVIVRRSAASGASITADLDKIKSKAADDVVLERLDIVDVGRKGRDRRVGRLPEQYEEEGVPDYSKLPLRIVD